MTSDGRVICGIAALYLNTDFWVHSSIGAIQKTFKVAGYAKTLKDRQLMVTPDGFVVFTLTDDPLILRSDRAVNRLRATSECP